jgi:hypothetical protein
MKPVLAAALAFTLVSSPLPAQTPPPPIVKVEGLRQISAHVHIIPDNSVPLVPNVGYVIGDRAVLVVDTGLRPAERQGRLRGGEEARRRQAALSRQHAHSSRA